MAISEAARADLYNGLSEALGSERAETLMSVLPFYELDEVATKGDIALLRGELKGDIASLRAELVTAIASEIGALRKTVTNWMLTLMVTVIGAIISVGLLS